MLYCKNCKMLRDGDECSVCCEKLTEPKEDDLVFLAVKKFTFARMLEDMLAQNEIPYLVKGRLGAAMTVNMGNAFEDYSFFVPFEAYEKANELLEKFFKEDN